MIRYRIRGQALTELAIFGTFVLVCLGVLLQFGLGASYLDATMMKGFRKAVTLAKGRSDPNLLVAPNPHTTVAFFNDKFIPVPYIFGTADANAYQAEYNDIVWSHRLDLSVSPASAGDRRVLQGVDYVLQSAQGGNPSESWERFTASSDMQTSISQGPGFTTQGWHNVAGCNTAGQCRKRILCDESGGGCGGDWFAWQSVSLDDPATRDMITEGAFLDVDGDGVEEEIVALQKICYPVVDDDGNVLREDCQIPVMTVLDNSTAEVDTNAIVRTEQISGHGVTKPRKIYQGMDPVYKRVANGQSTVQRTDSPGDVNTTTHIGNRESVQRTINTNFGPTMRANNPTQGIDISYDSQF